MGKSEFDREMQYSDEEWAALHREVAEGRGNLPLIERPKNASSKEIYEMGASAPGFDAEGNRMSSTTEETTTPAGLIIGANQVIGVVQAEVVEESNTQRLRRLLDEFDVFANDVHGNAERMHQIRVLAQRIERDAYVRYARWIVDTILRDELKANKEFVGQVGSKVHIRTELLAKLAERIEEEAAGMAG